MNILGRLAALSCLAIAGCGGGGGGGGDGNNGLSIGALSPSAVNVTVPNLPTSSGQDVPLSASYNGTATGPIYVVVVDPDEVFAGAMVDVSVPSVATLHLYMSGRSPIGRYTQPLVLHVCRDAACTSEFEGFPRTIQKDVTIAGTTANASSLSFTSSAGLASPSQALAVSAPAGADFISDWSTNPPYVTHTAVDGTTDLQDTASVFTITKSATGFDVHANAALAGHYVGKMIISTVGYANVTVDLDYQVGAAASPVVTPLTASVSGTGSAGSSADSAAYVDVLLDMGSLSEQRIDVVATGSSPDPVQTFWLRYYDESSFTSGTGADNDARRLRFYFNACFLGQNCLPPGTYTANIVYTATAWGTTSNITVPVTFVIEP